MSTATQSKVGGIIKSLSTLEDDLDSLHSDASDMRKRFAIRAQGEYDKILEEVRKMATEEAKSIISATRQKAQSQAEEIARDGEKRLEDLRGMIDSNFEEAVKDVVSAVAPQASQ